MAGEVSKPHDHLFRSMFGEEKELEAASLLQAYLPPAVSGELLWSSLKWQSVSFIDERLRDSESDLLYAIRRKADGAAAWLYVLLEHQSTPDPWLRLRLLKYSIRIWERDRQRHPTAVAPDRAAGSVSGRARLARAHEFAKLFAEAVRDWPGVPHYAHLLIDQTQVGPTSMIDIYGARRQREGRRSVHCDHDAGTGALAQIRGGSTATGAGRWSTDEQDRRDDRYLRR